MISQHVSDWLDTHSLSPIEVDCAIAVMLKILDGKCKMNQHEKVIMAELYQQVKHYPSKLLGGECHHIILISLAGIDDTARDDIYEKRVLAETKISRPVMKQFKARIRQQGLVSTTILEEMES